MERPSVDVRAFGIVIPFAPGTVTGARLSRRCRNAWQTSGIFGRNTYEEQSDCGMIKTLSHAKSAFVPHQSIETCSMALVAKKNVDESWTDAVIRLASAKGCADRGLAAFEARKASGYKEYEAAYLALQECGCLHVVDLPGDPQQPPLEAESDQIEPPGS